MRTSRSDRKRVLAAAGLAALAAFLLYANSIANGFVFDDKPLVERNAQIRSLRNLPEIFRTPYHRYYGDEGADTGHYRPLTVASLALNHAAGGLNPAGYHFVNVLLHALATGLVVLLGVTLGLGLRNGSATARLEPPARASTLAGAFVAGLLFAAHPIHTEAVANVAGRAELLAAVGFVGALLAYVQGRRVLAAVLFAAALLSKENALAFVGVAVAWEALVAWRSSEGFPRRAAASLGWIVAAVAAILVLRSVVLGSAFAPPSDTNPLNNPLVDQDLWTRGLTAIAVAARYAWLLVFPLRLSPDYSWAQVVPVSSPGDVVFLAGFVLTAGVAAALVLAVRRAPRVAFLMLLALLPFALVSNFPVAIATIMGERLLYLPSVGLCLLAGEAWARLDTHARAGSAGRGRWLAAGAAAIVLAALSIRTVVRNLDWHDGLRLFSKASVTSPKCARVWNNLGAELLKLGRVADGKSAVETARGIAPDWPSVRINLAQALLASGDLSNAATEAREAVRGLPASALARMKLGEVLEAQGDLRGAAAAYREGLKLEPGDIDARVRLGQVAAALGDSDTAKRELTQAATERPDSAAVRTALGLYLASRGLSQLALDHLTAAARLAPNDPAPANNLANELRSVKRYDEARAELARALAIDERFAPTHYNLGLTLEQSGKPEEAAREYRRALELDPQHAAALRALGRSALRAGSFAAAVDYLDRALRVDASSKEGLALRSRANAELGQLDAAERDLTRLLELDPGSAAVRENLARLRAMRSEAPKNHR